MDVTDSISCTLLLPRALLRARSNHHFANLGGVIELFLRWGSQMGAGRRRGRQLTTEYQKPGCQLQRVDFRVSPVVWHELGCYARALGISRCLAFVRLAEAYHEWAEAGMRVGQEGIAKLPRPVGTPMDPRLARSFLLYYDIVRVRRGPPTIIRRRKYVDDASGARVRRMMREVLARYDDDDPWTD